MNDAKAALTSDEVIQTLGLMPHPEGGYFRETFRHQGPNGERGAGTAIYFLLRRGETSRWHRVDAAEVWHFYAGDPLLLRTSHVRGEVISRVLGTDFEQGQRPQLTVDPGEWQSAGSLGAWTLVGCTVSPAFDFDQFELAPPGFEP